MIAEVDGLGIITVAEAADLLGVGRTAIHGAVRRGSLPARRFGTGAHALWLTTRDDVAEYRVTHSENRRRKRA